MENGADVKCVSTPKAEYARVDDASLDIWEKWNPVEVAPMTPITYGTGPFPIQDCAGVYERDGKYVSEAVDDVESMIWEKWAPVQNKCSTESLFLETSEDSGRREELFKKVISDINVDTGETVAAANSQTCTHRSPVVSMAPSLAWTGRPESNPYQVCSKEKSGEGLPVRDIGLEIWNNWIPTGVTLDKEGVVVEAGVALQDPFSTGVQGTALVKSLTSDTPCDIWNQRDPMRIKESRGPSFLATRKSRNVKSKIKSAGDNMSIQKKVRMLKSSSPDIDPTVDAGAEIWKKFCTTNLLNEKSLMGKLPSDTNELIENLENSEKGTMEHTLASSSSTVSKSPTIQHASFERKLKILRNLLPLESKLAESSCGEVPWDEGICDDFDNSEKPRPAYDTLPQGCERKGSERRAPKFGNLSEENRDTVYEKLLAETHHREILEEQRNCPNSNSRIAANADEKSRDSSRAKFDVRKDCNETETCFKGPSSTDLFLTQADTSRGAPSNVDKPGEDKQQAVNVDDVVPLARQGELGASLGMVVDTCKHLKSFAFLLNAFNDWLEQPKDRAVTELLPTRPTRHHELTCRADTHTHKVYANHFLVSFDASIIYNQYSISTWERDDQNGHEPGYAQVYFRNKKVLRTILLEVFGDKHLNSTFGGEIPIYDGGENLYLRGSVPIDRHLEVKFGRRLLQLRFKRAGESVSGQSVASFVDKASVVYPTKYIHTMDIALRECTLKQEYLSSGRSFYNKTSSQNLGECANYLEGFYQSLRPCMGGLTLNLDISTAVFHKPMKVLDYLHFHLHGSWDGDSFPSDEDLSTMRHLLIRLTVVVSYNIGKRFTINGISSRTASKEIFVKGDKEISVAEYFYETYGATVMLNIPLLKTYRTCYIPMDLCTIAEGQRFKGVLDDDCRKKMLRSAKLSAENRLDKIERCIAAISGVSRTAGRQDAPDTNLVIQLKPVEITARTLSAPALKYMNHGKPQAVCPQDGSWATNHLQFLKGTAMKHWALVVAVPGPYPNSDIQKRMERLIHHCNKVGMQIHPQPFSIHSGILCNERSIRRALESVKEDLENEAKALKEPDLKLQMLVCVMEQKDKAYVYLKKSCDVALGWASQCILKSTLLRDDLTTINNLAMKMNAKTGGKNWSFDIPLSEQFPTHIGEYTLILGADVTHPNGQDPGDPSIAAVVGNSDWPDATHYVARVRTQTGRTEMIAEFGEMVEELLLEFWIKIKCWPTRVVVFRDGVSESQFIHVLAQEGGALIRAMKKITGQRPRLTWVVVVKRHHTRLFPKRRRTDNVPPGTVVDTEIVHPREHDFFLVSHKCRQGTSRPAHYHVLHDESGFGADEMQQLCYNFCYILCRCNVSLSIPSPTQYAHLAAFRARCYVQALNKNSTKPVDAADESGNLSLNRISASKPHFYWDEEELLHPPIPVTPLPLVHNELKNTMYYV